MDTLTNRTKPNALGGWLSTAAAVWLVPLLLLLVLPAAVQAQFTFTTNNGALTVTGWTGSGTTATIPAMTNGRPVVAIGAGAFQFKYSLTSVTIPNSVTNIGDYALAYCGLTSVTIPSSVTSIGDGAFRAEYCLAAINVDSLNGYYSSLDGVLFNKSQSVLLQCPAGKTGIYTVPNSVTSIGDAAFEVCGHLTSVTIPNSVRTIGARAFSNCNGLTSMTIPNSVTTIGDQAFSSCFGLASVTIPNSITSIGSYAFDSCKSLTSVTIPNSVTSIGIWAFNGCTGLTNAAVGNSVTSIGTTRSPVAPA